MEITQEQYDKIEKHLPRQRGNVNMSNLQLINAILYVTENGCKWRALPEKYGKKKNRKNTWKYDKILYKQRNKIERYFLRLKRFRKIFTRYDKLDVIFCGFIYFAMIIDALLV